MINEIKEMSSEKALLTQLNIAKDLLKRFDFTNMF